MKKGLGLAIDIPENLPHIMADPKAMQQILSRLLLNAHLAAQPNSSIDITVFHKSDLDVSKPEDAPVNEEIYFAITDYGGGLDNEQLDALFAQHYGSGYAHVRGADQTAGLGLSIAQVLVQAHGGKMWAESEPGVSTTIRFFIPVTPTFGEASDPETENIKKLFSSMDAEE